MSVFAPRPAASGNMQISHHSSGRVVTFLKEPDSQRTIQRRVNTRQTALSECHANNRIVRPPLNLQSARALSALGRRDKNFEIPPTHISSVARSRARSASVALALGSPFIWQWGRSGRAKQARAGHKSTYGGLIRPALRWHKHGIYFLSGEALCKNWPCNLDYSERTLLAGLKNLVWPRRAVPRCCPLALCMHCY